MTTDHYTAIRWLVHRQFMGIVGRYIWYDAEGPQLAQPPLAVPNVTAHQPTASLPYGWAPFSRAAFPRRHISRAIHHAQFCPAQLNSAQSAYPDCRQSNKHWNGVDMSGKQAALLLEQGWERRVELRSKYWVACYSYRRLHNMYICGHVRTVSLIYLKQRQ